jgi:hypothetical protein
MKNSILGLFLGTTLAMSAFAGGNTGSIAGYKFNDLNSNGQDDNEPRLQNFEIHLSNGLIDWTSVDGDFGFIQLELGKYIVCEISPAPWIPTTPECVEVELTEKSPDAMVNFGNHISTEGKGCTRTQGYWGSSPAGQARVPVLVPGTMMLGTVAYNAVQLDDIFDQPVMGNAVLILAHQLIAAKLNILAGSSSASIAATIISADTALGALMIPPVGGAFVAPASPLGTTMVSLGATLADYNEGKLQVPHCP